MYESVIVYFVSSRQRGTFVPSWLLSSDHWNKLNNNSGLSARSKGPLLNHRTGLGLASMEISPSKSFCHVLLLSIIYSITFEWWEDAKQENKSIKQIKCQRGSADVHEDVLYLRLTYYSQQISCTLSTWWTAQKKLSFDVEFTILAHFPSTWKRTGEFFRRTCFSRLLMTSRSRFSSFPSSGVVKIMSTSWPNSFPLEMKTGLLPRRGSNDLLVRKIFSKSRILPVDHCR